jgi:DNA-binding transcriptional ArsR family regulator
MPRAFSLRVVGLAWPDAHRGVGAAPFESRKKLNQMVDKPVRTSKLNHMVYNSSATLNRVFHALAHPARRSMLNRLADGERNLTELARPLRMSFPAASKHVRVLERARLVRRRVVGRTHLCRIEPQPLADATDWLEKWRSTWEANFQRLDAVLEELKSRADKKSPRPHPSPSGDRP